MYSKYFPACPVDGPIEPPAPFRHLGVSNFIPQKCANCENMFEGSCTRYINEIGYFLELDYGDCGIKGTTDPIYLENDFYQAKVAIPRKCSRCQFLKLDNIFGFICGKDSEKWGGHRALDWGNWTPEIIFFKLPEPKLTTKDLVWHAKNDDVIEFIKEYRRINPGLSIQDAKEDFQYCKNILAKLIKQEKM